MELKILWNESSVRFDLHAGEPVRDVVFCLLQEVKVYQVMLGSRGQS